MSAQQLALEFQGEFAQFVQEDGSPRGRGGPQRVAIGAGKCPFHVPKKLAGKQGGGNGSTVDDDQRAGRAAALLVDGPGDQLLACPAGARNHNRRLAAGDAFDRSPHGAGPGRIANNMETPPLRIFAFPDGQSCWNSSPVRAFPPDEHPSSVIGVLAEANSPPLKTAVAAMVHDCHAIRGGRPGRDRTNRRPSPAAANWPAPAWRLGIAFPFVGRTPLGGVLAP